MSKPSINMVIFGEWYKAYYSMLCMIAYEYMHDVVLAEDMVEDTFLNIWEKRDSLTIESPKSYFVRAVKNTCLQYLRTNKPDTLYLDDGITEYFLPYSSDYPLGELFSQEMTLIAEKTIAAMPEQCRKVYQLSRDSEMTYAQIANALDISENTVKSHIKTALRKLREALKNYLTD